MLCNHKFVNNIFSFGFVEFMSEEDADYAMKILNMIKLFGKPIKVSIFVLFYFNFSR